MKIIKSLVLIAMLAVFLIACNNVDNRKGRGNIEKVKDLPEKLANLEIEIEGMTCEIGCARLIQSKLYKTEGVKFAKVSFEKGTGNITFDANKISNSELKKVIEKIAGGDLYKVLAMVEVENFKEIHSQNKN